MLLTFFQLHFLLLASRLALLQTSLFNSKITSPMSASLPQPFSFHVFDICFFVSTSLHQLASFTITQPFSLLILIFVQYLLLRDVTNLFPNLTAVLLLPFFPSHKSLPATNQLHLQTSPFLHNLVSHPKLLLATNPSRQLLKSACSRKKRTRTFNFPFTVRPFSNRIDHVFSCTSSVPSDAFKVTWLCGLKPRSSKNSLSTTLFSKPLQTKSRTFYRPASHLEKPICGFAAQPD